MGYLDELVAALENKNLSKQDALKLLKSNYIFCNLTPDEIMRNIFAIFNGPFLYAVLFCRGDYYEWSLFNRNTHEFSKIKNTCIQDDYIIRMVIHSVNKMCQLTGDLNLSLEQKMQYASQINISGYKVR